MAVERNDDAVDLRWYFCDAPGLVSGLGAMPLEASHGAPSTTAVFGPDDEQCNHAERERLIRRTLQLVPQFERSVLALYFGPSPQWRPLAEFRDLAGVVEWTAVALARSVKLTAETKRPVTRRDAVERATRPKTRDTTFLRQAKDQAKTLVDSARKAYRAAAADLDRGDLHAWAGVGRGAA